MDYNESVGEEIPCRPIFICDEFALDLFLKHTYHLLRFALVGDGGH